jgi:hypothetical protein
MMHYNILLAACMMVATTVIHAGGMLLTLQLFDWKKSRSGKRLTRIFLVCGVVVMMFFVSVLEVLVWAVTYLALDAIQDLEQAFYFSMVTFTTLGYGDVVLSERWRILSSFEAANGIIMFGWTTAIVITVVQRIYFGEKQAG